MAMVAELLGMSEVRPRTTSKMARSPVPAALTVPSRISGRMMTPTEPLSADARSSTLHSAASGGHRPASRGRKKEAFVDPSVQVALAAALKAELALEEFDAMPELFQDPPPSNVSIGVVAYHHHDHLQSQPQSSQHTPLPPASTSLFHDLPPFLPFPLSPQTPFSLQQQFSQPQPLVGRARAEKAAEFEVEHNWLLKEEAEIKVKKFDQTKRKLAICLPDDDPLEGISNRLEEIQSMVKPKVELSSFLEDLPDEQKETILKITNIDTGLLLKERRKGWTSENFVRNAFRMVFVMVCQCHTGRRYFNPDDPEAGPAIMRKQRKIYGYGKQPMKSSLSLEMQLSLVTQPEFRSPYDVKRVMWVLRATKAFKHLFPTEMEAEVAKVVGYERYDDNRHIGYQGRSADRFYYVLSGRIQLLKEYRLSTGCVNKPMGFWNKGMTSDPEELEQGWPRQCHLVSKGPVEVLILHKDDFIRLQHTVQGPPIDFLWSIDLFKEFPCDQFLNNPDAIEFKYYGPNRMIARDIFRTPWLHVVKSGVVKVVRVQLVFDVRNEKKFSNQSTVELGCGRSFSHAEAMLGLLAKQRKMKTMIEMELSLPEVFQSRAQASVEEGKRDKRRKPRFVNQLQKSNTTEVPAITVEMDENAQASAVSGGKVEVVLPPIGKSQGDPSISNSNSAKLCFSAALKVPGSGNKDDGGDGGSSNKRVSSSTRTTDVTGLLVAHGTFLTREKTDAATGTDGADGPFYRIPHGVMLGKKPKKAPLVRKAYLQLDLLKPGDVFGLENLDTPSAPVHEGPAISLVSDGAEVIKISKRFFLQHAQNNTMLRVETMQRSYLSTEEAKHILYDKETWAQYKNVLMQRLIQHLPRDGHTTGSRSRPLLKDS